MNDRKLLHPRRGIEIHDLLELVRVARANVVYVAAENAHRLRPGERADECDLALLDERQRGEAQRGAGIADQRQHASLLDQNPRILARPLCVVRVVEED